MPLLDQLHPPQCLTTLRQLPLARSPGLEVLSKALQRDSLHHLLVHPTSLSRPAVVRPNHLSLNPILHLFDQLLLRSINTLTIRRRANRLASLLFVEKEWVHGFINFLRRRSLSLFPARPLPRRNASRSNLVASRRSSESRRYTRKSCVAFFSHCRTCANDDTSPRLSILYSTPPITSTSAT